MPPPGGKITVTDEYGYLPKNPDEWPERLKQEIRDCCCGASSSPKPQPTIPSPCCNGKLFPSTIYANIKNTATHDTGMELRYFGRATTYGPGLAGVNYLNNIVPPWLPKECLPAAGVLTYAPAWYSDLYESFPPCTNYIVNGFGRYRYYWNSLNYQDFDLLYEATFTVKWYYYASFGFYSADQYTFNGGQECTLMIHQLMYPEGQTKWTYTGPNFGSNPVYTPITWQNAHPQGGSAANMTLYVPGAVQPGIGSAVRSQAIANYTRKCTEECGGYYMKVPISSGYYGGEGYNIFKSCPPLIGSTAPNGFPLPAVNIFVPGSEYAYGQDYDYREVNGSCQAGPYAEIIA